MINDRLNLGMDLLKDDGSMFVCIGDEEQEHLATLIRERYGKDRFYSNLIWEKKKISKRVKKKWSRNQGDRNFDTRFFFSKN